MNKFIEVDRLGFSLQVSRGFDLKTCENKVFIVLANKESGVAYGVTIEVDDSAEYMVQKIGEVLDKCIEASNARR